MELDGKHRSSEPFLVDYINNFISTLLIVPVSCIKDNNYVPRTMMLDGKHRSSEPFLVDYINNFISTLLIVPVSSIV